MSDDPQAPPSKPLIRGDLVATATREIVEGLGELGLSPPEAQVAAELVLWTFMENAMKLAPNVEMVRQSKLMHTRTIMRLTARIEAWPAKTTERN